MTPHPVDPRDPVLDFGLILQLARKHLPGATKITAVDETGGEGRTYFIDGAYVLKTQRPHKVRPRTSLEKEAAHLRLLAHHAPDVNVPRVLGYGRAEGVEYLLMTRMPGTAAPAVSLAGPRRAGLLRQLGSVMRRIHELPVQPFRDSGLFPGDAGADDVRQRMGTELEESIAAAATLDLGLDLESIRRRVLELAGSLETPVVPLHSNPGPEHVFVQADGELAGIIDFGDAYISHPAFDLRRWPTLDDARALLAGYGPMHASFATEWQAIALSGFLYDAAFRPRRRAAAVAALRQLLDSAVR